MGFAGINYHSVRIQRHFSITSYVGSPKSLNPKFCMAMGSSFGSQACRVSRGDGSGGVSVFWAWGSGFTQFIVIMGFRV